VFNQISTYNHNGPLQQWLQTQLFDSIPCSIAVINPKFKIVENNKNFVELFGEGQGKHCYQAFKGLSKKCDFCAAEQTFKDGHMRVNDETGVDKNGQSSYYIVHVFPIFGKDKLVEYVVEFTMDVTETKHLQKEYRMLFDQVPCYISVINRDFRIVRANQSARKTFGDMTGKHCYEVYKHSHTKCDSCPAEETFHDGIIHKERHLGFSKDGEPTSYVVATSPLSYDDGAHNHVIEIALDITEKERLERELTQAHIQLKALIESSIDGVIVLDSSENITLCNPSASTISGYKYDEIRGKPVPKNLFPMQFMKMVDTETKPLYLPETFITDAQGNEIPVRFSGVVLRSEGQILGRAAYFQDLRTIKELEKQKINAERLGAVGQTVAGLAHSIRNILTGLEGGIYVVDSGLERNQKDRITQGWGMLHRNIDRISLLVRSLLEFAGGRTPKVAIVNPVELTADVVNLFRETADHAGIDIIFKPERGIRSAPLDRESIHACLANLITNALDACQTSDKPKCQITVGCYDKDDCLIFEIEDEGCGMAYEVKQMIFTNFFTTKGTKGTGLGMLTVRKSTHEHGGKVVFESQEGKGSIFRLIFPRKNLPVPTEGDEKTVTRSQLEDKK
jgi:PAS domain S-box-containing protein